MERLLELLLQRQLQQGSNRHRASSPASTISRYGAAGGGGFGGYPYHLRWRCQRRIFWMLATQICGPTFIWTSFKRKAGQPLWTFLTTSNLDQEEVLIQALSLCSRLHPIATPSTCLWSIRRYGATSVRLNPKSTRLYKLQTAAAPAPSTLWGGPLEESQRA